MMLHYTCGKGIKPLAEVKQLNHALHRLLSVCVFISYKEKPKELKCVALNCNIILELVECVFHKGKLCSISPF